ncbi:hypothetical protein BT69DRAFT_1072858 [Atractiella rhizophila]|nr:hypothetical protein BT69DRAFT_1072858 [Atractiella rhizophila]
MSRKPDYGLNCKVWHAPLGGRSPESNFKSPPTSPRNDTIADINRKIAGLERTKQHHQSVHAQNLEKKVQELEAQLRQRQQNRRSVQLRGGLADLTPEQEEAAVAERNKKLFYELLHLDPPTDSFASTSTSSSASRSISTNASPATRFQSPNPTNLKLDHRAFPSISALLKSPQKPNKQVPPSTTPAIKRNRSASVAIPAAAPLPLPMFKPVPRATSSEEVPELVNWRSKREEAWAKEQELKMREVEIAREKMSILTHPS